MKLSARIKKLKYSAKDRGLEVRLMDYEYENLLNLGCHYCGKDVLKENGYCLDRIDNDKGYTLFNCVACCKVCNRAKSTMSFGEFTDWISKAYFFQKSMFEKMSKSLDTTFNYKVEKELHKQLSTNKGICIKV